MRDDIAYMLSFLGRLDDRTHKCRAWLTSHTRDKQ